MISCLREDEHVFIQPLLPDKAVELFAIQYVQFFQRTSFFG